MKTIKRLFGLFLIMITTLVISGCTKPGVKYLDPSTFDAYANEVAVLYIEGDEMSINYLFVNPEEFGLEHYEPSLPVPGVYYTDEELAEVNEVLGKYKQYDYSKLNMDQKLTYNIIKELYESVNAEVEDSEYMGSGYLGSYLGYQAQLPLLLNQYNLRTKLDVDNYFKYLDLVPETFKAYVDYEILKAENGYGMPNFIITKVINQCSSFLKGIADEENPHFMITTTNKAIDELDFLTAEEKEYYKELNAEKVRGPLADGYRYVRDHLREVYDTATNQGGLGNYVTSDGKKVGKQYYELMFQETVGYDDSMDDMLKYVEAKIGEYYSDINTVYSNLSSAQMNQLGGLSLMEGEVIDQINYFKDNIGRYFPEMEMNFNIEIAYVDPAMEDYFSPAAYMTSAIDDHENEFVILNRGSIYTKVENADGEEVEELDRAYLYTTLAHEAFPGHLYQNVYFKNSDASLLRKMATNNGYQEGWANYCESIAYMMYFEDHKGYSEYADDYFIANMNFSAALYTKVDIGIHYLNWTIDDTYAFMSKYYSLEKSDVKGIYQQLVEVPTNYPMYFFTYMKILDMRDYALENGATLKEFHTAFLDCGPSELQYVEEYIKERFPAK